MKEGYFQKKLTELAEEQQALSASLKLIDAEIDRLQSRIGDLKPLVKRLEDIEFFKEQMASELKKNNDQRIKKVESNLAESLKKQVRDITKKRADTLEQSKKEIEEDKALFKKYVDSISRIETEITYVKEYHRLLVMKLVNKGIVSYREQQEIARRASKKEKND